MLYAHLVVAQSLLFADSSRQNSTVKLPLSGLLGQTFSYTDVACDECGKRVYDGREGGGRSYWRAFASNYGKVAQLLVSEGDCCIDTSFSDFGRQLTWRHLTGQTSMSHMWSER